MSVCINCVAETACLSGTAADLLDENTAKKAGFPVESGGIEPPTSALPVRRPPLAINLISHSYTAAKVVHQICISREARCAVGRGGQDAYRGKRRAERRALKEARSRCYTTTNKDYAAYGGRGIGVWAGWLGERGFAAFLAHIGPKPTPAYSLDRVDNERGYEPGNVRWVDRKVQANNRRSSRLVEWEGEVMIAAELGRRVGLSRQVIAGLADQGWFSPEAKP